MASKSKQTKVGSLEVKTSKAGMKYLSGVAGGVKIVAFYDAKKNVYNVFKEKELPKADITDEELSF